MNKNALVILLLIASTLLVPTQGHAQRYPPPPPQSTMELERRLNFLEQTVRDMNYRLQRLEYDTVRPQPSSYYCIAKCVGASASAGGRGRTESEAKQAAFEELRKSWVCTIEIQECSKEN